MKRPIKIAVIGTHGAGKTTLVAGYAAVRPNVGGTDDTSRAFFEKQFKAWDKPVWPDPTKDENTINFRIGRKGRDDAIVSFAEYKGESFSTDTSYLERLVGKPEAALLLVNPRMSDFTDPQKRAPLETDTKKVIDYLVGLAGNPDDRAVLALVWTASDTTAAKSDEFKTFSKRIFDYVGGRLPCKEFPVSLFGPMEDESVPPGRPSDPAKNTAPAPFEWVLEIVESRRRAAWRRKVLQRTLQGIGTVLLAALIGLVLRNGCRRVAEDGRLDLLQSRFDRFERAPADNADPQSLKNWKTEWTTATNVATDRTRARLVDLGYQFESSLPDWQRRQLENESDEIVSNLDHVAFTFPLPQSIIANFQNWYRQAKRLEESRSRDYSAISEEDFASIRMELSSARQYSKDRFKNALPSEEAIKGTLIETVWKPLLAPNEYESFKQSIQDPVIKKMTDAAKEAIDSLESISGDPTLVLQRCKRWCTQNQSNPDKGKVVGTAISLTGDWLLGFSEQSRQSPAPEGAIRKMKAQEFNNEFDNFRRLCEEAKTSFWDDYATRWPIALGRECANQSWFTVAMKPEDAFRQTFKLSKVDVVWHHEEHWWANETFDGFRISFDVFKRGRASDVLLIGGPPKSRKSSVCQLKRTDAEQKGLPMTVTIWQNYQDQKYPIVLGEELYIMLNVRDSLSGLFTANDSEIPFELTFSTDTNGVFRGLQPGGFVGMTKSFHFPNSKDTAKLTFLFYVSLEGKSLESMIAEFQAKDPEQ